MCPTPKRITDFGQRVMDYLVNQQFDLVDKEIENFKKERYTIYYKSIPEEEYESPHFIENARKIMWEAKKKSKGWHYQGILVFYPFMSNKDYLHSLKIRSVFPRYFSILFGWSVHFNEGSCLSNQIFNQTGTICEDTNIHLMIFYVK